MGAIRELFARDPLLRHLHVQIRCGKDKVMDLEFFPRIYPRGTRCNGELAHCGDGNIGSAIVRDQVDLFYLRHTWNEGQGLSQVIDRETAGLPIVRVAEQPGVSRGPGIDDRHSNASQVMSTPRSTTAVPNPNEGER